MDQLVQLRRDPLPPAEQVRAVPVQVDQPQIRVDRLAAARLDQRERLVVLVLRVVQLMRVALLPVQAAGPQVQVTLVVVLRLVALLAAQVPVMLVVELLVVELLVVQVAQAQVVAVLLLAALVVQVAQELVVEVPLVAVVMVAVAEVRLPIHSRISSLSLPTQISQPNRVSTSPKQESFGACTRSRSTCSLACRKPSQS